MEQVNFPKVQYEFVPLCLWRLVCTYFMQGCQMPCMVMLHISLPLLPSTYTSLPQSTAFFVPRLMSLHYAFSTMASLQAKESDDKKAKTTASDNQPTSDAPPSYTDAQSDLTPDLRNNNEKSDAASLAPSYTKEEPSYTPRIAIIVATPIENPASALNS